MSDTTSSNETWGFVAFIIIFVLLYHLYTLGNQVGDLKQQLQVATSTLETTQVNLDQCVQDLTDDNTQIRDAHLDAWSDYDAMGSALEYLHTIDTNNLTSGY